MVIQADQKQVCHLILKKHRYVHITDEEDTVLQLFLI